MKILQVNTKKRTELVDITREVQSEVDREGMKRGIIFLYVPHTTAGLTVNENADPSVKKDILEKLSDIVPEHDNYSHAEGNSDAHVKASMTGNQMFFIVEEGRLKLGTWQGIYFCEFDGPRNRQVYIKLNKD